MLRIQPIFNACLIGALLYPALASALTVEIQGVTKVPEGEGSSCIDIEGSYPGFQIVPSERGKQPRICFNSNKTNSIAILNTTLVATEPSKNPILIKFEHEFPSGINGKVMARTKFNGFFTNAHGVGTPAGNKLNYSAAFVQNNRADTISDPLDLTVSEELDSALFDYAGKKQYLISGPRVLRGGLKVFFTGEGQKLTLSDKSNITIDTGSTMADKLESMPVEEPAAEDTESDEATGKPAEETGAKEGKAVTPKSRPTPSTPKEKVPATTPPSLQP